MNNISSSLLLTDEVQGQQESIVQDSKEMGIWVFILGDIFLFSVIFGSYAFDRSAQHDLYYQSQQLLNESFAVINTLLLLTGSLFVILALHIARQGQSIWTGRLVLLTIFAGVLFLINKAIEYTELIQGGHTLLSNDFFTYYFMVTGLHMVHVVMAICVLIYVLSQLKQSPRGLTTLESGGAIWHMVDVLWIVLFPLIYLIR